MRTKTRTKNAAPASVPDSRTPPLNYHRAVRLGGIDILLPEPPAIPSGGYMGGDSLIETCLAAWEAGLHPRLTGALGVGKNALVYELARLEGKPPFILQGHAELLPEDIAATAHPASGNRIEFVASPLMAAMLTGGILLFDEISKTPHRGLDLLAAALDDRRVLSSSLAAVSVVARPGFRFIAATNDDDPALPGYLAERLLPRIPVVYPYPTQRMEIVRKRGPADPEPLLEAFRNWLSGSHRIPPARRSRSSISLRASSNGSRATRVIASSPGPPSLVQPNSPQPKALIGPSKHPAILSIDRPP